MFVSAIDISAPCYGMCYLQLTLAGIPAQVIRGNSLSLEIFESAWTASMATFLANPTLSRLSYPCQMCLFARSLLNWPCFKLFLVLNPRRGFRVGGYSYQSL